MFYLVRWVKNNLIHQTSVEPNSFKSLDTVFGNFIENMAFWCMVVKWLFMTNVWKLLEITIFMHCNSHIDVTLVVCDINELLVTVVCECETHTVWYLLAFVYVLHLNMPKCLEFLELLILMLDIQYIYGLKAHCISFKMSYYSPSKSLYWPR